MNKRTIKQILSTSGKSAIHEAKNANTVMVKTKDSISKVSATVEMKVKNGTVTFNLRYKDGGGENGIPINKFSKMLGATR